MGEVREAISDWAEEAKKHAGWLVVLGVVTIIAGILAIAAPMLSGFGVSMMIGFALIVGGIARTISAFSAGSFGQGTLAFLGGILAFVAGVVLVFRPGVGVASLTLALGIYLLVDGFSGSILAFRVRPDKGWGWMLFSGVLGVLLGIMLLKEWPVSGLWAVGTLVGINMIFAGFSIITIGSAAKGVAKRLT